MMCWQTSLQLPEPGNVLYITLDNIQVNEHKNSDLGSLGTWAGRSSGSRNRAPRATLSETILPCYFDSLSSMVLSHFALITARPTQDCYSERTCLYKEGSHGNRRWSIRSARPC